MTPAAATSLPPRQAAASVERQRGDMLDLLARLVAIETPSTDPGTHAPAFALLAETFADVGLTTRLGNGTLVAWPAGTTGPVQLLLGHVDTVWPLGTTRRRPPRIDGDRFEGPGAYDMKAGLVQAVAALAVARATTVDPVVVVNADEEVGSPRSTDVIRRIAQHADRAFVLEPSLGPEGRLKTARKGVARYVLRVAGRAAHAGLDPGAGASAILELSHVVQRLFALNDPVAGISVNVGTIDGGVRPNVVAPEASAVVDVRAPTAVAAHAIDDAIRGLRATTPGTHLQVEGGFGRPPMERTDGTGRLFALARDVAGDLGVDLLEGTAGGGSDGNTTAPLTPTLDGLGAVGDGAHAEHEHVRIGPWLQRTTLLACLLAAPPLATSPRPVDVDALVTEVLRG